MRRVGTTPEGDVEELLQNFFEYDVVRKDEHLKFMEKADHFAMLVKRSFPSWYSFPAGRLCDGGKDLNLNIGDTVLAHGLARAAIRWQEVQEVR